MLRSSCTFASSTPRPENTRIESPNKSKNERQTSRSESRSIRSSRFAISAYARSAAFTSSMSRCFQLLGEAAFDVLHHRLPAQAEALLQPVLRFEVLERRGGQAEEGVDDADAVRGRR